MEIKINSQTVQLILIAQETHERIHEGDDWRECDHGMCVAVQIALGLRQDNDLPECDCGCRDVFAESIRRIRGNLTPETGK